MPPGKQLLYNQLWLHLPPWPPGNKSRPVLLITKRWDKVTLSSLVSPSADWTKVKKSKPAMTSPCNLQCTSPSWALPSSSVESWTSACGVMDSCGYRVWDLVHQQRPPQNASQWCRCQQSSILIYTPSEKCPPGTAVAIDMDHENINMVPVLILLPIAVVGGTCKFL
jgi:hypothetical protein